MWLVNARGVKRVPGLKTDVSDARWIAQVAQHGLVSPSFVPPPRIRRLRDLTRQRTNLVRERSRALNRLEKVLEDAGIKTALVLTKTLSMSSRAMIEALVAGERDPVVLADLAIGKARSKMMDVREALAGRFEDHHAFLASQALAHIDSIDAQTAEFDRRIETETAPMRRQHDLLTTIPGISTRLAQVVIAETGVDMTRFPTAGRSGKLERRGSGEQPVSGPELLRRHDPRQRLAQGRPRRCGSRRSTHQGHLSQCSLPAADQTHGQETRTRRGHAQDRHRHVAHAHQRRSLPGPRTQPLATEPPPGQTTAATPHRRAERTWSRHIRPRTCLNFPTPQFSWRGNQRCPHSAVFESDSAGLPAQGQRGPPSRTRHRPPPQHGPHGITQTPSGTTSSRAAAVSTA